MNSILKPLMPRCSLRAVAMRLCAALLIARASFAQNTPINEAPPQDTPAQQTPAENNADPSAAVLTVAGGSQFLGQIADGAADGRLLWESPRFKSAIDFPLNAVVSLRFPSASLAPTSDFAWQLVNGDVVVGKLVEVSPTEWTIESPELGALRIRRDLLSSAYRLGQEGANAFEGPAGLSGWTVGPKSDSWIEEEAGSIRTTSRHARLTREVTMPVRARVELELHWTGAANFSFQITRPDPPLTPERIRNPKPAERRPTYGIEVVGGQWVAIRETAAAGDIAILSEIEANAGELHLLLYIDQEAGTYTVCRPSGEVLAKLDVKPTESEILSQIRFLSREGDLRLTGIRITPWSGPPPGASDGEILSIALKSGDSFVGRLEQADLKSADASQRRWTLNVDGQSRRIAESDIREVRFRPTGTLPDAKARLELKSGLLLTGEWLRIAPNQLHFRPALLDREVVVAAEQVRALYQRAAPPSADAHPEQRLGRLETTGVVSMGWLANEGGVVAWLPLHARAGVPFTDDFSGRIVYRELPPVSNEVPPHILQAAVGGPVAPQLRVVARPGAPAARVKTAEAASAAKQPVIHLRTGDIVHGEVLRMSEAGVEIRSTESSATFIAHKDLRAIELVPNTPAIGIHQVKVDRLLMLPRSQQASPPTHLIRSNQGDYLRCRITSMNPEYIEAEVRLETKRIPRNTVSRIIWLHPEEILGGDANASADAKADKPKASSSEEGLLFQAIPEDRKRMTLVPQSVEGSFLRGKSRILGDCQVDLRTTNIILIGAAILDSNIPLAYEQWKLRRAPEPLAATEGGDAGGSEGLESVLVGKPAPAIDLKTLDGKKFVLADRKSKVVILDFWASWCGPCMQAMPQIHQVAEEFASDGVELVGVNLQEEPDRINNALQRLKLDLNVALDVDGRIAERYGATAIPQTVIIDAQGNVARVFVGGGPRLADQLRQSLRTILGKPADAEPAEKPSDAPAEKPADNPTEN